VTRRVDVEIVWGTLPATSPVGADAPPVVRVERTDPVRPFYAVGWARKSRVKPKPTLRIIGPERERHEKEAWADYLALSYVIGRAVLDGESLEQALESSKKALPVAHRVRVEKLGERLSTTRQDDLRDLGADLFGEAARDAEKP